MTTFQTTRSFCTEYIGLLDRIHRHLRPRSYVEIGVYEGRSLARALPGTVTVGIDPDPVIIWPINSGARVFATTSDEFFSSCTKEEVLGEEPLDLAFIDGMHHFDAALRDFMNLEKWSNPRTTILVHDCYPHDELTAGRDRTTDIWSGDVWKLVVILKRLRPDLHVTVVDVKPTGLAVISALDATSTVLDDRFDEIVESYLALPFAWLSDHGKEEALNLIPNHWPAVRDLLPALGFRDDPVLALRLRRLLRGGRAETLRIKLARRTERFARPRGGTPVTESVK